ncbi:hypothetical protein Phi13:1_gp100 [Cellulophaga phage phi13:1]|nr:hypothetical protein Phi13:1_gp100 [Cellulophaga phage phi13:1]
MIEGSVNATNLSKVADRIIESLIEENNLIIPNIIHWLEITEELPEHGETVLTYTPTTEMAEEQIRLIKYGSLKSGFPAGITHWKYLDKPNCVV